MLKIWHCCTLLETKKCCNLLETKKSRHEFTSARILIGKLNLRHAKTIKVGFHFYNGEDECELKVYSNDEFLSHSELFWNKTEQVAQVP